MLPVRRLFAVIISGAGDFTDGISVRIILSQPITLHSVALPNVVTVREVELRFVISKTFPFVLLGPRLMCSTLILPLDLQDTTERLERFRPSLCQCPSQWVAAAPVNMWQHSFVIIDFLTDLSHRPTDHWSTI